MVELVKDDMGPKTTEFVVIQSDNDPLVYEKDAEKWAKELNGELVIVPGLGHLTIPELPEILNYL